MAAKKRLSGATQTYEERLEKGRKPLNIWVSPETLKRVDLLCKRFKVTKTELFAILIQGEYEQLEYLPTADLGVHGPRGRQADR